MSVGGSSPLGTLLLQRVDAALGVTLSQQANIVSGAHPHAVTQPGHPERAEAPRLDTHSHPREAVDRAAQGDRQGRGAIDKARLDARTAAWLTSSAAADTSATPSAPTTLGHAARTILALLANHPDHAPPVLGRQALLNPQSQVQSTEYAGQPAAASGPAGASPSPAGQGNAAGGGPAAGHNPASAATERPALAGASFSPGGGTPVVQALTQALAQALQGSGLFYESHLDLMMQGRLGVAQLMQEPQAQLGRMEAHSSPAGAGPHAETGDAAGTRTNPNTPQQAASAARGGGEAAGQPASLHGMQAWSPPGSGIDPQAGMLVRQQLDVLAHQAFSWRGEAWPEAPMEWEVSRHPAWQGDGQPGEPEHWATQIAIQLPALGQVRARLTLSGQEIVMHLVAPDAAPLLKEHTEALRARYAASGLQLSRLSLAAQEADAAETTDRTEPT